MMIQFFVEILVLWTILRFSVRGQQCPYDDIDASCVDDTMKVPMPKGMGFGIDIIDNHVYPYMVSFQKKLKSNLPRVKCYQHFCGGTMIAPNLALTAAHCMEKVKEIYPHRNSSGQLIYWPQNNNQEVYFAAISPQCRHMENPQFGRMAIDEIYIHSEYRSNFGSQGVQYNDIAIVQLVGKNGKFYEGPLVKLSDASMDIKNITNPSKAIGYGKEKVEPDPLNKKYTVYPLHGMDLNYLDKQTCKTILTESGQKSSADALDYENMVCFHNPQADTCSGDSGGPLMNDDIQIGIVSWGPGSSCSAINANQAPSVFVRLPKYVTWIQDIISKHGCYSFGLCQRSMSSNQEPASHPPQTIVPSTRLVSPSPSSVAPPSSFCDQAQDLQCDVEALQSFKNKITKGADLLSTWTGENPCTWRFITCKKVDGANQRVTGLDVNFEDDKDKYTLSGIMVPDLSKLRYLNEFHILNQNIAGTMPPEYSTWKLIQNINLDSNKLTGELKREYSEWTELVTFSINENQFSGTIPPQFSAWKNIETISMAKNSISGSLPIEFSQMTNMKIFRVDGNRQLYGYLPKEYSTMSQISSWNSSDTRINQRVPVEWSTFSSKLEIKT